VSERACICDDWSNKRDKMGVGIRIQVECSHTKEWDYSCWEKQTYEDDGENMG